MRTPLSSLQLVDPRSLQDALEQLHRDPELSPLAGCTDIYVGLNAGAWPARRFLNLWRLDELRGIGVHDGVLRLGALTTYSEITESAVVARFLPMLAEAARQIGGVQVRNRGTLGGNLGNASPAGDTLPVFAVAEATVVLRSISGERRVACADFFTGYRRTARRDNELIEAIEIPPVHGQQWFRKVGTRSAQAISKVVMAAVRAEHPRIAFGSVAPTVVRATSCERLLAIGAPMEQVRAALSQDISPIDDFRSSAAYRRAVAGNLVARFWTETGTPETGTP
ncbi:MAG: xanthine dehydrogenase family protein subunit M [Vicinamibacterales bacterium]